MDPVVEDATPWRRAAAQVLVEDLATPELDDDAAHHLGRVLRLRAGDEVCAADGAGGWRSCRFDGRDSLEPLGEVQHQPAPPYPVTVAFALVKGDKPELVVQKLTELGVDRIVPFAAQRSVVRWDTERAAKHLERMRRVAVEACAQSRRLWLPTVGWDEAGAESAEERGTRRASGAGGLATIGELAAAGAVAADAGGRAPTTEHRVVMVGPEGGWADGELDTPSGSVERIALGEHVLRAETAAITAGVVLTTLRAGLVRPVGPSPDMTR
ncbi:MAG: RsmE family RNA methyltransferase [Microthrixaceae bacterium]